MTHSVYEYNPISKISSLKICIDKWFVPEDCCTDLMEDNSPFVSQGRWALTKEKE